MRIQISSKQNILSDARAHPQTTIFYLDTHPEQWIPSKAGSGEMPQSETWARNGVVVAWDYNTRLFLLLSLCRSLLVRLSVSP